ncbi:hypothetical protein V2I01_32080 [Micromonospora sp. BRA006-A]|nr:hypothetical protein [Micromonospora sp. BRA006-A]
MTQGEVNNLLEWPGRLRQIAAEETVSVSDLPDVEIGLVEKEDGKVLVLPTRALPRDRVA